MKKRIIKSSKKSSNKSKEIKPKEERIKTFIPGFDTLIVEGIPFGSTVLVEGGPGNGKTIFCLNILKNMREKGKGIIVYPNKMLKGDYVLT